MTLRGNRSPISVLALVAAGIIIALALIASNVVLRTTARHIKCRGWPFPYWWWNEILPDGWVTVSSNETMNYGWLIMDVIICFMIWCVVLITLGYFIRRWSIKN